MLVDRIAAQSTSQLAQVIVSLLRDARTERVVFFATEGTPTEDYTARGGLHTNLPMVVVLGIGTVPSSRQLYTVCDAFNFMSAVRGARLAEVKDVTDEAVESGKAYFVSQRAPFTGHLPEGDAVAALTQMSATKMDASNVVQYRRLLQSTPGAWD